MNRNNEKPIIYSVLLWVYAMFGIISSILAFVSCFGYFAKEPKFYIVIVLVTGLFCSVFMIFKTYKLWLLVYCIVFITFAVCCFKNLAGSAVYTINQIIDRVNTSYNVGYARISLDNISSDAGDKMFLIFAVALITMIVCFFTLEYFDMIITITVSLMLNSFGIFYDIFPKMIYLAMSVVFWVMTICLYCCGRRKRQKPEGAVLSAYITGIIVAVLFVICSFIFPEENYNRDETAVRLETSITNLINKVKDEKIPLADFINSKGSGIGHGEFGKQDEISYTEETMLVVKLPDSAGNVYLRGAEYDIYEGNSWDSQNSGYNSFRKKTGDLADCNIINESYTLLKGAEDYITDFMEPGEYAAITDEYFVTVENIREGDYTFAPYGALVDNNGKSDKLPADKNKKKSYDVYYAQPGSFLNYINLSGLSGISTDDEDEEFVRMIEYEKEYAQFARKAYTKVPDELKDVLSKYAAETVAYDYKSELQFAKKIQDMFASSYTYTLSPGRVPAGMDGVEYFLEENKKGYCVYFASAATLIFRMAGIPARYVEGYVVTPGYMEYDTIDNVDGKRYIAGETFNNDKDYVTVSVKDSSAHAWPEIYIPEYGWIPIEVTPGYTTDIPDFPDEDDYYTEEYTDESQENTESNQETKDDTEETDTKEAILNTNENESGKEPKKERGKDYTGVIKVFAYILFILLILYVCALVIVKWMRYSDKIISRLVHGEPGKDGRAQAVEVWNYLEKLFIYFNKPIPEEISYEERCRFICTSLENLTGNNYDTCVENVVKAYFGNRGLTKQQCVELGMMIRTIRKKVLARLNNAGRFNFKYIRRL